jgi:hypothetical protein
MMLAFGEDAKAIRGSWSKGLAPSINIDKVNELTAAGRTLDEAIHAAWTVTRARKLGFNRVKVVGQPEGVSGAYVSLEVLIEQ